MPDESRSYYANELTNTYLNLVDAFINHIPMVKMEDKGYRYKGRFYFWKRKRRILLPASLVSDSNNPLLQSQTFRSFYDRHDPPPAFLLELSEYEAYQRLYDLEDMANLKTNCLVRTMTETQGFLRKVTKEYEYCCYSSYKGASIFMPHMPLVGHKGKFDITQIFRWIYGLERDGYRKQPQFWISVVDQDFHEAPDGTVSYFGHSKYELPVDEDVAGFIYILQELRKQPELQQI